MKLSLPYIRPLKMTLNIKMTITLELEHKIRLVALVNADFNQVGVGHHDLLPPLLAPTYHGLPLCHQVPDVPIAHTAVPACSAPSPKVNQADVDVLTLRDLDLEGDGGGVGLVEAGEGQEVSAHDRGCLGV